MFWIPLTDITATMNEHHCFLNPLGCEHLNFISVKTMILFIYNILPGQFCIRIPHQHTKSYCLFYSPGIPIWKESTTIEILLIAFFDNWRETPLYNTESEISENAESSFASKFKPIPHFFLSRIARLFVFQILVSKKTLNIDVQPNYWLIYFCLYNLWTNLVQF